MRSNLVFTGPIYPHDIVINVVKYIRIMLTKNDLVGDYSGNTLQAYIKNLSVAGRSATCTVYFNNPETGGRYVKIVSSDAGEIGIEAPSDFSYSSNDELNISACCVTVISEEQCAPKKVTLSCDYPVVCDVEDGDVNVYIVDLGNDVSYSRVQEADGINSINGVNTVAGDIRITGVGSVTVTVTSGKVDEDGGTEE